MEYDYEALEQKKAELLRLAQQAIRAHTETAGDTAESVVDSFIRLTPPTKPEMVIEMITMDSLGRGGGRSRKPGNIYLNWRKLIDTIPDVTIAAVGGATAPGWLLPLIGLYVWNKLWCNSEEELTEVEATAICALWKNKNSDNRISEDDGYEKTNAHRKEMGLPLLSRSQFDAAMNRLLRMECIEIEEGIIWLREWVRKVY